MVQDTVPIFFTYFSPSDEFFFGVSADAAACLRADFLQEGMSRIANLFASFTCLMSMQFQPGV